MEATTGRTPQEVFQHHAEALGAEDLEGIVSDYVDDAVFITPEGMLRGKEGVRKGFVKLLGDVPGAGRPGTSPPASSRAGSGPPASALNEEELWLRGLGVLPEDPSRAED
jgi:hypothetical protein